MTQEEREAVEWVDMAISDRDEGLPIQRCRVRPEKLRTLKRMLSRPALPSLNDHAAIDELAKRAGYPRSSIADLVKALTTPRTKEIEVWHVEYVQRQNGVWCPEVELRFSPGMAEARANKLRELSACACIRVTGPHRQSVPDEGAA